MGSFLLHCADVRLSWYCIRDLRKLGMNLIPFPRVSFVVGWKLFCNLITLNVAAFPHAKLRTVLQFGLTRFPEKLCT
jgi:hypothetical protein